MTHHGFADLDLQCVSILMADGMHVLPMCDGPDPVYIRDMYIRAHRSDARMASLKICGTG